MSTLFFEGFNVLDGSQPYLDTRYWTRPFVNYPVIAHHNASDYIYNLTPDPKDPPYRYGTQANILISGYRLDTNPPEFATPLQLSGISNLNSDELYIAFRVFNLSHNYIYNNNFPYTTKFLSICSGNNEILNIDVVRTTGQPPQSPSWPNNTDGLGLSVTQNGDVVGLFDLRISDLVDYTISLDHVDYYGNNMYPPGIQTTIFQPDRYIHLEFLINRIANVLNIKIDGVDIYNGLNLNTDDQLDANIFSFSSIDNIKFYSRGVVGAEPANEIYIAGLQHRGIVLDDLIIHNNSGSSPNSWIGPDARIYHMNNRFGDYGYETNKQFVKKDWNQGAAIDGLTVRDNDNSYLYSSNSGDIVALQAGGSYLTDEADYNEYIKDSIGGVRVFGEVAKTQLNSDFTFVYGTGLDGSAYVDIDDPITISKTNYQIKNSFLLENPVTQQSWGDSSSFFKPQGYAYATSGYFGIKKL